MSQENVEIVRRWIDAYNRRDIDGLLELSDVEIEFKSIFAAVETGGVFRGQPGVYDYFKTLDDAYGRFEVVPRDFIDAGASVLVIAGAEWRGKESGAEGTTSIFVASHLKAGRMLRVETFTKRPQALEAVGLQE